MLSRRAGLHDGRPAPRTRNLSNENQPPRGVSHNHKGADAPTRMTGLSCFLFGGRLRCSLFLCGHCPSFLTTDGPAMRQRRQPRTGRRWGSVAVLAAAVVASGVRPQRSLSRAPGSRSPLGCVTPPFCRSRSHNKGSVGPAGAASHTSRQDRSGDGFRAGLKALFSSCPHNKHIDATSQLNYCG